MKISASQMCSVCGYKGKGFKLARVINKELADAWKIDENLRAKFDARESSFCPQCENSARTRGLASAILSAYPLGDVKNLEEWVLEANKKGLRVAEINSCGKLHFTLSFLDHLSYSEYVSKNNWKTRIKHWLKKISNQDFSRLGYFDSSFDLVLHSEVIEHVNDPDLALSECRRVLKKDGVCLFTVPLILSRFTKRKATIVDGQVQNLDTPSFHGSGENDNLVFWEFGHDAIPQWHTKIAFSDPAKELYVLQISK